jgi:hypothetical protein
VRLRGEFTVTEISTPALPARRLAAIDAGLVRSAAVGGLLGGLVLFVVMASYNAGHSMGFWSIVNACFAAFVYKNAGMNPMMEGSAGKPMMGHEMMNSPIVANHLAVGSLLHLLMSAASGIAFVLVLAVLLRIGGRAAAAALANPVGYVLAGAAGGALLYVIMMYGVAPVLNDEIVHFTPRVPFFISHLLFGAVATGWVYVMRAGHVTRTAASTSGLRHRPA